MKTDDVLDHVIGLELKNIKLAMILADVITILLLVTKIFSQLKKIKLHQF